MESSWEGALARLAEGVEDLDERARLASIVRGEFEQLERIANRRGEKLKTIVEATTSSAPGRPREVVVFPSPTIFRMQIAPYDARWFEDRFSGPPEPMRFLLRPLPDEQLDIIQGRPATCTLEDPDGEAAPGDLRVALLFQGFELETFVAVFKRVGAAEVVGSPAPATVPLDELVTASRVCDAVARGRLRVEVQRKAGGVVVSFADVP